MHPSLVMPAPEQLDRFHRAMGHDAWRWLGAHPLPSGGFAFAVWAPRALEVHVHGDFNGWRGAPLEKRGACFYGQIVAAEAGQRYKLSVRGEDGAWSERADPMAFAAELRPATASRLVGPSDYVWRDQPWLERRRQTNPLAAPMSIYELHLGSWLRHHDGRPWGYAEVAERLADHVASLGFSHVELLPIAEFPYDPSWGYQVTGFFAPTARYGSPDHLRALVDTLHSRGIGVILDWVPAHFPKDAHALARFDGAPLYEYADPRLGAHPDWGTLVFDYARPEVRSFLLASADYWISTFHIDGLRVDAVASMLYLDYSREPGAWLPNRFGGRHNLDAISFLQDLNRVVRQRHPGVVTIAEESTAFPHVTGEPVAPLAPQDAGLGFTFKWNMGWMHDTLSYFKRAPEHRPWHHHELTFASSYAAAEAFVLPLSHDEVVHGKGSLITKMAGDWRDGAAQLRVLYGLQWLMPGKKLLFMGGEFGQEREWDFDGELVWAQASEPVRQGLQRWIAALNALYRQHPALRAGDHEPSAFRWIDADDAAHCTYAFARQRPENSASARDDGGDDGGEPTALLVVVHASDQPRPGYVLPTPHAGPWRVRLHSHSGAYVGEATGVAVEGGSAPAMLAGAHGDRFGVLFDLPPYAVVVLEAA